MGDAGKISSSWDFGDTSEDLIHRIHPYPARFPAFITTKAIEHAEAIGVRLSMVADVFCGCGTTAVEAKRVGIDFWGCDINPLATLIAQVKTHQYRDEDLERYVDAIWDASKRTVVTSEDRAQIGERIRYWFEEQQVDDLIRLDRAIRKCTHAYSPHRKFFQCGFSAILKATSLWLTKSIKAQKDPKKEPKGVMEAFAGQIALMRRANENNKFPQPAAKTQIRARNFLGKTSGGAKADLIVTSPPYVTSYNYADIHQLSTLWLGYAEDYRSLRRNMLGNRHGVRAPQTRVIKKLGDVAWRTYRAMRAKDPTHAMSVARYFVDLDKAVRRCWSVLEDGGMAVFVIGNTHFNGVKVDNAANMEVSMGRTGFKEVHAIPRKVSLKIMTPYRDALGRFTRDSTQHKVYAQEYVLIGRKT